MAKTAISPWRVLIPVGVGTGLSLIGDAGLYAVLPTHPADAGIGLASVGILLSANRFVRLLSNGGVGWLADRWPRRTLFVPALFLGALSTLIYALTSGFWPLLLGRLLWGVAWSGIWIAGNAIIFDIVNDTNRGRWVGIYHISFFTGAASGAILGGALTDVVGYPMAMGISAGLTLTGALVALIFLPETRSAEKWTAAQGSVALPEQATVEVEHRRYQVLSVTALLGINRILVAGILASSFGVFLLQLVGDSVSFMGRTVGVATLTGVGMGLSTLLSMLFTPLVGGLSDRTVNRWRVVTGGLLAGVVGFSLLAVNVPWAVVVGLPLIYLSSSSNQGLSTAMAGDLSAGGGKGKTLGALFTIGDLGSAVGPPLAYALIPVWGATGVYWLSAALFGLMLAIATKWAFGSGARYVGKPPAAI